MLKTSSGIIWKCVLFKIKAFLHIIKILCEGLLFKVSKGRSEGVYNPEKV